jgi:hypothetical protein
MFHGEFFTKLMKIKISSGGWKNAPGYEGQAKNDEGSGTDACETASGLLLP